MLKQFASMFLVACIVFVTLPDLTLLASYIPIPMEQFEDFHEVEYFDDLVRLLSEDGQVYKNLRVQSDYTGIMTYRVPFDTSELMQQISRIGRQNNIIQPLNNPFDVTRIMHSGLSHEESIVIILLGDGFTAEQY